MASTLFTQNIIACIWDFDKTLIPGYMQAPLFRRYGIDEANFWAETNKLVETYKNQFNSEISSNGIDGLIKALSAKNKAIEAKAKT